MKHGLHGNLVFMGLDMLLQQNSHTTDRGLWWISNIWKQKKWCKSLSEEWTDISNECCSVISGNRMLYVHNTKK